MNRIPVIDLATLSGDHALIGAALGDAARGTGFFALTGHDIPAAQIKAAFAQSKTFFASSVEAKAKLSIARSGNNRGYIALGEERLNASKPGDVKEAFNIGWDLAADHPFVVSRQPFRDVNAWPDADTLPEFRKTMLEYFNACHLLGIQLHWALAHDLGVAEGFFDDSLDMPLATLRLLHYPPRPERFEPGQIGAGEHTDYGNITLLATDDAGGLEVRTRSGEWISQPTIPGALICNIGDCLMRWTNDVYVSTPHRVLNPVGRERYSIAFFLDPNPDAVVECLPSCVTTERPARYAPTTGAAYLKSRLDATYSRREKA